MKKLAIIDADSLTFQSSRETLEESIQCLNDKIQNIFDKTECTHFCMFVSNGKYYRHNISPEYKISRNKYKSELKWLKTLKSYLVEHWNAQSMDLVESDDLCAYWMNKYLYYGVGQNINYPHNSEDFEAIRPKDFMALDMDHKPYGTIVEKILCACDKDLLKSIPGKHFNFTYKLENKEDPFSLVKGWWVETSGEEANYFRLKQYLIGDDSDCVKTIFPESAGDWFVKNKMNFNDIVSAYILGFNYETPTGIKKYIKGLGTGEGLYELSKNVRLLHMLDCDEDFTREIGQIPSFPIISEVPKKEVSSNDVIDF